jgi:hypothetical protein
MQPSEKKPARPKRVREQGSSDASEASTEPLPPAAAAAAAAVAAATVPESQALMAAITGGSWPSSSLLPPPTKQARVVVAAESGFGQQENQFLTTFQVAMCNAFAVEPDIRGKAA